MDLAVLGLSIAVALVLLLLYKCWMPKNKSTNDSPPMRNKQSKRHADNNNVSEYGRGVQNKQFRDRYGSLAELDGYDDYNSVVQYMSIEPEVYHSQAKYTKDMGRSTSGASMLPVRDDPNDVVPWIGLRRPKYRDVYSSDGARQDHSEIPDQMRSNSSYCIG
jgi:hypothetical protein